MCSNQASCVDFDAELYQEDYKQCWRALRRSAHPEGYEGKPTKVNQGKPWMGQDLLLRFQPKLGRYLSHLQFAISFTFAD